jgi:hypothetical protein
MDNIEIIIVFSGFLLYRNILIGNIWNNYNNYYNMDTLFLFLLNDIFKIVF